LQPARQDPQVRDRPGRIGARREVIERAAIGQHVAGVRPARPDRAGVGSDHVGALVCARVHEVPGWCVGPGDRAAIGARRSVGSRVDRGHATAVRRADATQSQAGGLQARAGHQPPDLMLLHGRTGGRRRPSAGQESHVAGGSSRGDIGKCLGDVVPRVRAHPGGVTCGSAEHEVVGEDRIAVLVVVRVAARHELVLERRRVHDQRARASGPALGVLDRRARGRADVLERVLGKGALELRLDHVGDQPGVAHVTRADDREGRRGIRMRHRRRQQERRSDQSTDQRDVGAAITRARPREMTREAKGFEHGASI